MTESVRGAGAPAAYFHLPGLFEFYELYRTFLPLWREHREYFYDWCEIGSIYGAPAGCLWGGGRVELGERPARDVLALTADYGISARLTFSNSLLREEHLADRPCNALCALFETGSEVQNGVIVHSELLLRHLMERYPGLYFVSSTTKVLTDFDDLRRELGRPEFRYVVPDFRLNRALTGWTPSPRASGTRRSFCATSAATLAAPPGGPAMRRSAEKALGRTAESTAAPRRGPGRATASPGP